MSRESYLKEQRSMELAHELIVAAACVIDALKTARAKHTPQQFTDEGDVVIDPCCGSGSTLLAAQTLDRKSYGFEVDRNFYNDAIKKLLGKYQPDMFQSAKWEGKL